MLAFGIKPLGRSVGELPPGSIFFVRHQSATSLAMKVDLREEGATWLVLNGPHAFEMRAVDRGGKSVVPLDVDSSSLRVRVDPSSATFYDDHKPGQLLFDESGVPCIASVWPELANEPYRNAVALNTGRQVSMDRPSHAFDRWALSYLDESGHWLDIVSRSVSPLP